MALTTASVHSLVALTVLKCTHGLQSASAYPSNRGDRGATTSASNHSASKGARPRNANAYMWPTACTAWKGRFLLA
eukprot:2173546-Amphidinium_carterae.3